MNFYDGPMCYYSKHTIYHVHDICISGGREEVIKYPAIFPHREG